MTPDPAPNRGGTDPGAPVLTGTTHQSQPNPAQPSPATAQTNPRYVVLAGNPNCGKTTLFNALTGLRAKVGNYPGVTVERREGRLSGAPKGCPVRLLDLPGCYSLSPISLDERVAHDILFHRLADVPAPALVVVIADASNLQRHLYFATQVIELGYPTFLALNKIDVARQNGHEIDTNALSRALGIPVFPVVASRGTGVQPLRQAILDRLDRPEPIQPRQFCELPAPLQDETKRLAQQLAERFAISPCHSLAEARLLLGDERFLLTNDPHYPAEINQAVQNARARLDQLQIQWRSAIVEARYACLAAIERQVLSQTSTPGENFSDRLDQLVTHRFWGWVLFLGLMTLMFQSIFTFAQLPMEWLEHGVGWLGHQVRDLLAPGPLNSLLVDGVINGVGAVVVFLPQICLLFLFIGLLEDTGYMARAAFLMDRLMSKVGLHGRSFIPMLSSFACAIPGILATRTIESAKDRLTTILVAPLMSCSARLPVYTVLIAACIPNRRLLGLFGQQGLTLLAMYLLGVSVALAVAWLLKKTLLRGPTPMLIMELPPYKRPELRGLLRHMWDRAWLFVTNAGTVILGMMILLWALASYPKNHQAERDFAQQRAQILAQPVPSTPPARAQTLALRQTELAKLDRLQAGAALRYSFAGRMGRALEPILIPLGFDWKIGIGIVGSFAAREIFVSTMSLVYNVGQLHDSPQAEGKLVETMRRQRHPDGRPVYTALVGVSLMVFYVFALQCASTVAVVRRETRSWRWPLFQWAYMGLLAWTFAFLVYQGGRLLGWG